MNETRLIAAIAETIKNGDTLVFGDVESILMDKTGVSITFADRKKFRITVEEAFAGSNAVA